MARQEHKPFYNSAAWRKLRELQLRTEPLCRACLAAGRVTAATVADHIEPLSRGGDFFGALQSMCATCHQLKTNAEQRGKQPRIPGCDVRGIPLDPNHPWNQPTDGDGTA